MAPSSRFAVTGVVAAIAACMAIGMTHPPAAAAFSGENLVIETTPQGPTLTDPAKTILTNPTFLDGLPDGPATRAATRAVTFSEMLPIAARVLPWVGGVLAAKEVCTSLLGGCWIFAADEPDPPPEVSWRLAIAPYQCTQCTPPLSPSKTPAFSYYTNEFPSPYTQNIISGTCSGLTSVPNAQDWLFGATSSCASSGTVRYAIGWRLGDTNRTVRYGGSTDDPAIPNYTGNGYCNAAGACAPWPDATGWDETLGELLSGSHLDAAALSQQEMDEIGEEVAHQLDPRCHASPFAQTVEVPEVLEDETADHYRDCLDALGLDANVITLDATDTTVADGAVVETVPDAGTELAPQTQVDVAANPSEPTPSTEDARCYVNGGSGQNSDPGEPPSDGTGYPNYQLVEDSPYPVMTDPSGSSPAITEMPLRWGTTGWGWRHIRRGHSFTAPDRAQTELALASDPAPIVTGLVSTNQWDFHLFYEMSDGAGGTLECLRTVRVEYFVPDQAQNAGLSGIRGIQNSFVGRYTGGIPGH
jgi:hypothetical protein